MQVIDPATVNIIDGSWINNLLNVMLLTGGGICLCMDFGMP